MYFKRSLQTELEDINWYGPLPEGVIRVGFENSKDGAYWLVVGTIHGNKKVMLS